MKKLESAPLCDTCDFFKRIFPQNKDLGICPRLGILLIDKESAALVLERYDGQVTTEVPNVRVTYDFGCPRHSDYLFF